MTLDDLDNIRSSLNVLRGELAAADIADFAGPLADLGDAVQVLDRPGLVVREFPLLGRSRPVEVILKLLQAQRVGLEMVIHDAPALHGPAGVALHDLNRAIAGIVIMLARLKLRAAT